MTNVFLPKVRRFVRVLLRGGSYVALGVGLYFFLGINFRNTKADTQVLGSGIPGFVAQWIAPPPLVISDCGYAPNPIRAGQTGAWSATVSGGVGGDTYVWSGSPPLDGDTRPPPVYIVYTTTGPKSGSVTVTSGTQTVSLDCGSVNVLAGILSFTATPTRVTLGNTSVLSWNTAGFGSCVITADQAGQDIGPVDTTPGTHSQGVTPSKTTVYTLNCDAGAQIQDVTIKVIQTQGPEEKPPQ